MTLQSKERQKTFTEGVGKDNCEQTLLHVVILKPFSSRIHF